MLEIIIYYTVLYFCWPAISAFISTAATSTLLLIGVTATISILGLLYYLGAFKTTSI